MPKAGHDLIRAELYWLVWATTKKINRFFTSITLISRSTIAAKATRNIHTGPSIEARIGRRTRLWRVHLNVKVESRHRVVVCDGAPS